jgi:hypothetical protein
MRQGSLGLILALAVGLFVIPACAEQVAQFDPHDLSGYWTGPPPSERPPENSHPPYTEAGQQRMIERAPDYIEASNWPDEFGEAPGCRTVSCRNDPMFSCNPMGFPRITWEENEVFEIVQLPDRIMHFYQWDRVLRELWMDGRELPSGETLLDIGPNWYGHSVAEWEGDTLVVNSTGFEPRAWPDQYGHPLSADARIEERFRLIDADTMEGRMTIDDPANYTGPWEPQIRIFTRVQPEDVTFFGWKGLFSGLTDGVCAPMNEVDEFNSRVRDRGIFGDTGN